MPPTETSPADVSPTTGQEIWEDFQRPLPEWYRAAKLGIFIHWGAYSVPAWGEPTGELGTVDEDRWFRHNAYAEWYANTIRIPDSPAAQHHDQVYGGAPYDDLLDAWHTDGFDASAWARLFAEVGASYVVLTTKHHDGITLWDAPGTGARNTVWRGPRRDLVGEVAAASRAAGLRFGVYYSGGLDWSITDLPPHTTFESVKGARPVDAAYNAYAYLHVRDLLERYEPDVLWNDIEWPDAGKRTGSFSLHELFRRFYDTAPDGVVNDRWGDDVHHDVRTSEYQFGRESQVGEAWEHNRGIGLSFGYNRNEGPEHTMSGGKIARHLADVVSRGGRLLLNVGPSASGEIPALQRASLEDLAAWMREVGALLHGSRPASADAVAPSDDPWVRWIHAADGSLVAFVDGTAPVGLRIDGQAHAVDRATVLAADGRLTASNEGVVVEAVTTTTPGPAAVVVPRR